MALKFESILKEIGECGRAQIVQYLLLCIAVFNAGLLSVDVVFFSARPKHHCSLDSNQTDAIQSLFPNISSSSLLSALVPFEKDAPSSCKAYRYKQPVESYVKPGGNWTEFLAALEKTNRSEVSCDKWTYASDVYGLTFVNELNLVCDRKYYATVIKMLFFGGRLFGAVVLGQVSDRFGRLPTFLLSVAVNVLTGIGLFFSRNVVTVTIFIFTHGIVQVGFMLTCFVLGTELVGPNYRKWFGIILQAWYAGAMAILPGISLLLPNWHHLALVSSIPSALFLSYAFFVKESPRWLMTRGRNQEALAILKTFAKRNGKSLSEETEAELLDEQPEKANSVYTAIDLLRTWSRAKITLNVWFNWVVNSLVYYGIIFNLDNIGVNPYINMVILGLIEFPAYGLSIWLLDILGRKRLLIGSLFFAGAFCTICGFVPKDPSWAVTLVAMLGKFGITISYGVIYFFTAELFPTCIRNVAVGMGSTFARVGGTLSNPILRLEDTGHRFLPMLIFGVMSLAAGVLAILLPETKGTDLKNTFDEKSDSASSKDSNDDANMQLMNEQSKEKEEVV